MCPAQEQTTVQDSYSVIGIPSNTQYLSFIFLEVHAFFYATKQMKKKKQKTRLDDDETKPLQ